MHSIGDSSFSGIVTGVRQAALLSVVLIALGRVAEAGECPIAQARKGWVVFADMRHGFCFEYPASYHRKAGKLDKGLIAELDSDELRKATADDRGRASIDIELSKAVFGLNDLVREAPTGVADPPSPVRFGALTFYYYGAGGGGVAYPDRYYLDLRGRTLMIRFQGPYPGYSKWPSAETQKMERELLGSFRVF